jgi:hypothetical protein
VLGLIDSVIITVKKTGKGVKPSYNLEVNGDGNVVFVGYEKVKKLGETKKKIDNNRFLELLSLFKNVGFFSLPTSYDYSGGQSRVFISISIPKDDGSVATKSVSFYEDDPSLPEKVKDLEGRICDIVDVKDLIGSSVVEKSLEPVVMPASKPEINKSKKESSKPRFNKKKIGIFASVVVVIVILFVFLLLFFKPGPSADTTPVFDFIGTASSVNGYKDFEPAAVFDKEKNVYVYCEFSNVIPSNDSSYDIRFDVSVFKDEKLYSSFSHYVVTYFNYTFFKIDILELWSAGNYTVSVELNDNNSGKKSISEIEFELYEKEFSISTLHTEKQIYTKDFVSWFFFDKGETVYVYVEYEGLSKNTDGSCELFIRFDIQEINGDRNLTVNVTENNSGNRSQRIMIETDDTWQSSGYYITCYLKDLLSGKTAEEISSFFIE